MRRLTFALVLLGFATLSGCALSKMAKMAKDQELTVTPNPLEVHNNQVDFEISAILPVKMLKKGKVYRVSPVYTYGNSEMSLKEIDFVAEDFPNRDTEQPRRAEKFSFPYSPELNPGVLAVEGAAIDPRNGKSKSSPRLDIATGLITTATLAQDVYFAGYADHGYNNQEELVPTNVEFFFEQGRSQLRVSERNSTRGKQLSAFIAEKNVTRTVTITGTHSPEGTERINSNLSKERAEAIEKYYREQMRRFDYKDMAGEIKFILKPVVEDWNEFKKALNAYDKLSQDQKNAYLSIVNGSGSFEEKEKALQKLSTYKQVFNDIYPGLRAAKTEVLTVKEKKTDAEISVLAKQITENKVKADTLSAEELGYAATLTPSLSEKEAIFKELTKKTGSAEAHNNLGAVYLEMAAEASSAEDAAKYVDMAVTQLEISVNKKDNALAKANLGVAYLMQGNNEKALENLSGASGLSAENQKGFNGVIGLLQVKTGKYDAAVSTLANANEEANIIFNRGLAQLLKKDYQNALTSFKEAAEKDKDLALAHYGAAIASARLSNAAGVASHLKEAVTIDSSLKQKALSDLEFRVFANTDAFKDALK